MERKEKYGFSLIRVKDLDEIDAKLYEFEHIKTGAKLIRLDREDENKSFAIAFPTPPTDDTGVFHIIEHSVLCGSEKYPLRDPFAELLKGSLNTFLNAITYEDRTVYPVSSRCEKDFLNLVDVYMDAVFAPKLLENPAIFMQEGWHYEYNSENRALEINGVVYNEMKGAYSSPDELGGIALNRALFGNEIYRYDSGGNPDAIPDLTYEKFRDAYKKHYHPSSAKIVLDGRMDTDAVLKLLDSHLSRFERRDPITIPDTLCKKIADTVEVKYEISENESEKGRARLLLGYVFSDYSDREGNLIISVLSDLLCGSNASPLKKALLDRGLAKDAAMYAIKSRWQTAVIEVRDADETRLDEIESTIKEVLLGQIEGGIDKSRLTASLNSIEFRLKERDFGSLPTGIAFASSMIGRWIYGGDPEDALLIGDSLANIREKIEIGYFEDALMKMTLGCDHRAKVIMLPDRTLGEKLALEEEKRLSDLLSKMTDEEIEAIIESEKDLRKWQTEEETEEARDSLPKLSLSDIRTKPERPKLTVTDYNQSKILDCNAKTNGIVYISLSFDASDLEKEELIQLSVLSTLLINSPTEKHDALSLQNDIKANLGTLFATIGVGKPDGIVIPYLKLGGSALIEKKDDLVRLVDEIMLKSRLESDEDLKNILMQIRYSIEEGIVTSGESVALSRVEASFSEAAAIGEYLSGYEAYRVIREISEDDEKIRELREKTSALLKNLADRRRLTVSVAGDYDSDLAKRLVDIFPDSGLDVERKITPPCAENEEFFLVPGKVAYAVSGGPVENMVNKLGLLRVARSILSYEYLWNMIRVKGGAYGAGFVPRRDGSISFYSYRDPSPDNSLKVYRESADYLRQIAASDIDITKFIIGTIGEYDVVTTPRTSCALVIRDYLSGWTDENEEQVMRDILAVKREDLYEAADIIEKTLRDASVAVVGGKEHLDSFETKPKRIITI